MTQPTADPGHKSARVTMRPIGNPAKGGSFSLGVMTGILPAALAANSEIFQFRWAPSGANAAYLAVIREIRISAAVSTTFFAAGVPVQIDAVKCTGWSAAGSGGAAIAAGATMKKRTSMPSSLIGANDVRIATTAALGAGTKTIEANSLAQIAAGGPITGSLSPQIINPGTLLWAAEPSEGEHPLVLAPNEGIIIRSRNVPATGTWSAAISIDWTEVDGY